MVSPYKNVFFLNVIFCSLFLSHHNYSAPVQPQKRIARFFTSPLLYKISVPLLIVGGCAWWYYSRVDTQEKIDLYFHVKEDFCELHNSLNDLRDSHFRDNPWSSCYHKNTKSFLPLSVTVDKKDLKRAFAEIKKLPAFAKKEQGNQKISDEYAMVAPQIFIKKRDLQTFKYWCTPLS